MAFPLVLVSPLVLGVILVVATLVALPHRRRQVAIDEVDYPGLARLRRRTSLARVLGVAAGLAAAVALAGSTAPAVSLGRGVLLAPTAFGVVLVLALTLGDWAAHSAARGSGASLEPRRVRDVLPRPLTALTGAALAVLVALLAAAAAVAAPTDGVGRAGRALAYATPDGTSSVGASPWPGAFYGLPLAAALVVLLAATGAALVRITRRPAGDDEEIRRVDAVVRRREAESVVAAAGLSLAVTLVGVAMIAGRALGSIGANLTLNGEASPWWFAASAWACVAVVLGALGVGLLSGVTLVVPGPAAPRGRRVAIVARTRA